MKIFTSITKKSVNKISLQKFLPKFNFTAASAAAHEIKITPKERKMFYPIKGLPEFKNGVFTVFEYQASRVEQDEKGHFQKLPQVPYEIKEHALKGFIYTFFLVWAGRLFSNFSLSFFNSWGISPFPYIPLGVFTYHYLRPLYYMANAISAVRLKEDGTTVIFEFKNIRKPLEVEIWRISKNKEENFLNECYTEPFLFPITIDYTDIYGEFSLRSKRKFYLYGDSNSCIKHGEILRAILNSESIKLK